MLVMKYTHIPIVFKKCPIRFNCKMQWLKQTKTHTSIFFHHWLIDCSTCTYISYSCFQELMSLSSNTESLKIAKNSENLFSGDLTMTEARPLRPLGRCLKLTHILISWIKLGYEYLTDWSAMSLFHGTFNSILVRLHYARLIYCQYRIYLPVCINCILVSCIVKI